MLSKNYTVLLVDDDPVTNFITERTLSRLGVSKDVRSTLNGQQALQLISDRFERGLPFPAVILLDLNMPIMNGFQFIKAFKKLDFSNLEKVKIIIVTSSEDRKDMQRAESLGISDYLVKPFLDMVNIFNFN